MFRLPIFCLLAALTLLIGVAPTQAESSRPNILWIVIEDASPHLKLYGDDTIDTPNIDALGADGLTFANAMITHPVCSPARSAMITGMFSTTLGSHNHRSQTTEEKGGGNTAYYESYELSIPSVPQLFREAGYHVTNTGKEDGKEDYNFIAPDFYEKGDWTRRQPDQPFFAQIQLSGGKWRRKEVDVKDVTLPPHYLDHPVIQEDLANYYSSWLMVDRQLEEIIGKLREQEVLDNTVIFFFTDHGISQVRGKQFVYDEGLHIPFIIRFGDGRLAGTVRHDMIHHIDIAATSLALAGIEIPAHMQSCDVLAADYEPRTYTFAARDRCDETVDIIRSVRTDRYKYIRNFMSYRPHLQFNQYRDRWAFTQVLRELHAKGELDAFQSRLFNVPRPVEELYDLQTDPHEMVNLAGDPAHRATLEQLRGVLYERMQSARDMGLIPEPILEDMGRAYGNKYFILQQPENATLVAELIAIIEAGERGDISALRAGLDSSRPSIRYWAATWLGNHAHTPATSQLQAMARDDEPAVRVAAALALCQLGHEADYLPVLAELIDNDNLIVGLFAIRALEQIGEPARAVLPAIKKARQNEYEFTRRIARRMVENMKTD